ncbi:MAG: hypothetical protein PHR35_06000 [Kiritimatiellae bacterium]|nr:hypothetical protein [Kiritimatiellia bacterium]
MGIITSTGFLWAMLIAGVLLTSLMLPGTWLVLAAAGIVEWLAQRPIDPLTVGILCVCAAIGEGTYYFTPPAWRGTIQGDRAIGRCTTAGACLGGLAGVVTAWSLCAGVAIGGAAAAWFCVYRRERERAWADDDDANRRLTLGGIVKRIATPWLRVCAATGLGLWGARRLLGPLFD